jgi:putative ABC transport system permease protein
MATLVQDLRYAVRWLVRNPGFTAVAVATLALAVGVNAAIFTFVRGVLLRPLPYPNPSALVQIWERTERDGQVQNTVPLSYPNFLDYRKRSRSFESMAAYSDTNFNLTGRGVPELVPAEVVSASFFRVLGVRPTAGRTFREDEDQPGRDDVAVITQKLWQRLFAGSPAAVGATLTLNGKTFVVVGVVPSALPVYNVDSGVEVFVPVSHGFALDRRGAHWLGAIGRLRDGVSLDAARADLAGISSALVHEFPDQNTGFSSNALSASEQIVGEVRPALLLMLGAVGLVLLIAAANVANMQLARATARTREIAVRAALGAGRGRLVLQLFIESLVLALAGAAVGLLLAFWGVDALRSFAPADLARLSEVRVDGSVVAFAVGAAFLAALIFGVLPAWSLTRRALGESLKESPGRATGARGNAVRQGLVVAQLALSLVLVTGAGLLLRSLFKLQGVDLGFAHRGILTFEVDLPVSRYGEDPQAGAFHDRLLERLRALPGVAAAETAMNLPMTTDRYARLALLREGVAEDPSHPTIANFAAVSPGLLGLLRVPVVEGRALAASDTLDRPKVAVVNREFARRFYPGQEPVGRRVSLRQHPKAEDWTTIVGVIGDFRDEAAEAAPAPQIYTPYVQNTSNGFYVLLGTARDRAGLIGEVRREVAAIDPEQPIYAVKTFDQIVAASFGQPRFRATLLGGFGLLALALAAIGIYGVMAYSVAQRTREIGIRMALGAAAGDVLGLVLRQAVRLSVVAVAAGLVGSAALARGLASFLYAVRPIDPVTFASVALLLVAVASLAAWVPARRAARVDPIAALRNEG